MENQVLLTQRNNQIKSHQGYLYNYHKLNRTGDRKFWRCGNNKKNNCRARLHTDINDEVLELHGEHICQPNAELKVQVWRILDEMKRRAAETMDTPAKIREIVLQDIVSPDVLAAIPSKNATAKVGTWEEKSKRKIAYLIAVDPTCPQ
jgi:hypothetical protein